jgi:hypothetical protein
MGVGIAVRRQATVVCRRTSILIMLVERLAPVDVLTTAVSPLMDPASRRISSRRQRSRISR